MSEDNRIEAPRIYPTFRYRNSGAMLTWLTETVGFREIACYRADDGSVAHAELAYGSSMIMIGHTQDDRISPTHQTGRTSGGTQ